MGIIRLRRPILTLVAFGCVATLTESSSAQQADPLVDKMVGTWKVNLAKSAYHPGPPPAEGAAATWTKLPNGFRQTGLGPDGKPTGPGFVGYFDGKEYPDRGNGAYDSTVMTRVDDYSFIFVRKKAGQIAQMATRVISADGKTSTITVIGFDAQGKALSRVVVWEKQ